MNERVANSIRLLLLKPLAPTLKHRGEYAAESNYLIGRGQGGEYKLYTSWDGSYSFIFAFLLFSSGIFSSLIGAALISVPTWGSIAISLTLTLLFYNLFSLALIRYTSTSIFHVSMFTPSEIDITQKFGDSFDRELTNYITNQDFLRSMALNSAHLLNHDDTPYLRDNTVEAVIANPRDSRRIARHASAIQVKNRLYAQKVNEKEETLALEKFKNSVGAK